MTVPMNLDVRKTDAGLEILRIQNNLLLVEIIPQVGGKIWTLFDKGRQRQWLWRNPDIPLGIVVSGSPYDDNFLGGWDELFPNDAIETFEGRTLSDHGDVWSQSWNWKIEENDGHTICIHMITESYSLPGSFERWITINEDSSCFSLRYRIQSNASTDRRFLWKLHPAIALAQEDRIELPGGYIWPVDLKFSTLLAEGGPFEWPMAKGKTAEFVDLSNIPSRHEYHKEFVYVTDLPAGWCGIFNKSSGARLRIHFPLKTFKSVWLFLEYGAWKGYHTVVLEPCTNWPKLLNQASTDGCCASLKPHESQETIVEVCLS